MDTTVPDTLRFAHPHQQILLVAFPPATGHPALIRRRRKRSESRSPRSTRGRMVSCSTAVDRGTSRVSPPAFDVHIQIGSISPGMSCVRSLPAPVQATVVASLHVAMLRSSGNDHSKVQTLVAADPDGYGCARLHAPGRRRALQRSRPLLDLPGVAQLLLPFAHAVGR